MIVLSEGPPTVSRFTASATTVVAPMHNSRACMGVTDATGSTTILTSSDCCSSVSSAVRRPGGPTEGTVGPGIVAVTFVGTSVGSGPEVAFVASTRSSVNGAFMFHGLTGTFMALAVDSAGPDLSYSVIA